ncbi:MAG: hypothetical protein Q7Q73_05770 [Verrucomicrobiota bacterium JB024]|nr:hypothetical protein [Verrucomicrobiota bacterium JB024]
MDSLIPITIYRRQNHRVHTYPAGRCGAIGVLMRNGEYHFMWCRGAIKREDVPAGVQPVKLEVEAWSWEADFVSRRNYTTRGRHLVGVRIGSETFIVFYGDAPREA